MKKLLLSAIICSMVIGLAGCDTDNDGVASEPSATDSPVSSSTVSLSESEQTISSTSDEANDTDSDSEYWNWRGINVYLPSSFTGERQVFAKDIFSGKMSTDDTIYYYLQDTGSVSEEYNAGNYTLEDVPEYYSNAVYQIVYEFFRSYESDYTVTVDTEKKVDVLGTTFLRRTGTIHTEYRNDETHDLYYAAYYGVVDTPGMFTEDCPVVWLTFAECTDEKTKADVELVVDTIAETATFNEEDVRIMQEYTSDSSSEESSAVSSDSSVDTE